MIVDLILRLRGKETTTRSRSRVALSLVARARRDNACAVQYQQFEDQAQDQRVTILIKDIREYTATTRPREE